MFAENRPAPQGPNREWHWLACMTTFQWILVYCVLIVAGSYLGGWLPSLVRLKHTTMQVIISFIGGLMLGVSLFHLLPHGVILTQSLDRGIWWSVV